MILLNTAQKGALVVLGSMFIALSSSAQMTGSDVESQLHMCAKQATDSARLACYDGLVESLQAAGSGNKTDDVQRNAENNSPAVGESERPQVDDTTGIPLPTVTNSSTKPATETFDTGVAQKQSIRVMIEKTKRNARGDWYFYFDNGEVWKQIDTRGRRIPPLPNAATVSRGIFSSHKLHIDGEVWSMKIRRVK